MLTTPVINLLARVHTSVHTDGIIKQPGTDANTPFLSALGVLSSWVFTLALALSVLIFLLGLLAVLLGSLASMSQVKTIGWKAAGLSLIVVVLSGSAAALLLAAGQLKFS